MIYPIVVISSMSMKRWQWQVNGETDLFMFLTSCFYFCFVFRIERLWRDVFENVIDLFYTTFHRLEAEGWLNPDKETDLYALHRCYMPHIQSHLQQFQRAWNNHSLRTARNQSPLQLWWSKAREGNRTNFCQVIFNFNQYSAFYLFQNM